MEIRQIDLKADKDQALLGMKDFISRMEYTEFIPDDEEELWSSFVRLYELGVVSVVVADHEGELVGGIGMVYSPCIWNINVTAAEELFWWAYDHAPITTALRLIRRARQDVKDVGCAFVTFKSLTSSPKAVDSIYRKMGLKPIETNYMGAL